MGVDFLGIEKKPKKKLPEHEVRLHIPEEDRHERQKAKELVEEKREEFIEHRIQSALPKEKRVSLTGSLSVKKLQQRLRFFGIFAILIVLLGAAAYVLYVWYTAPATPVTRQVRVIPEQPSVVLPTVPVQEQPLQEEVPAATSAAVPLPDTPLAPLRGSLVRFAGDPTIYLVEDNGELRTVQLQTVVFDNGQRISQISLSLIYLINDRWKSVRQGREVSGQVDWDPRVLQPQELNPFL